MDTALGSLGMDSVSLAFTIAGVLVLALAIRAARNAAIAIRARIFAVLCGVGLLGYGLKGPLHAQSAVEEALGPWIDEPHERVIVAVVVLGAVLAALLLFSIYLWVRAFVRLASFALVGLALLSVAGLAWLATEGGLGLAVPPVLGVDGLVLCEITGIALLAIGALRALRPAPIARRA